MTVYEQTIADLIAAQRDLNAIVNRESKADAKKVAIRRDAAIEKLAGMGEPEGHAST